MIIIKKRIGEGVTAEIELDENTEFYAHCPDCGKLTAADDEIINEFGEYLCGNAYIYCHIHTLTALVI